MFAIKFNFPSGYKTTRDISFWARLFADIKPVWDAVFVALRQYCNEQFRTQGKGKWSVISEDTMKKKMKLKGRKAKYFPATMSLTGRAYNAFTKKKAKGSIRRKNKKRFEFGAELLNNDVDYVQVNDDGIQTKKGFKRRKIFNEVELLMSDSIFQKEFELTLTRHLIETAKRANIE